MDAKELEDGMEVAKSVAFKIWRQFRGFLELEDVQAEAMLCMLKARKLWVPSKSKFKTFAQFKIYYFLIDWVRVQSLLSRNEIRKVQAGLREPLNIKSFESIVGENETLGETLAAKPEPYYKDDIDDLLSYVKKERDRQILVLYYLEGKTMQQVAEAIGVSESRVSQRHSEIIERLREIHGSSSKFRRKRRGPAPTDGDEGLHGSIGQEKDHQQHSGGTVVLEVDSLGTHTRVTDGQDLARSCG